MQQILSIGASEDALTSISATKNLTELKAAALELPNYPENLNSLLYFKIAKKTDAGVA